MLFTIITQGSFHIFTYVITSAHCSVISAIRTLCPVVQASKRIADVIFKSCARQYYLRISRALRTNGFPTFLVLASRVRRYRVQLLFDRRALRIHPTHRLRPCTSKSNLKHYFMRRTNIIIRLVSDFGHFATQSTGSYRDRSRCGRPRHDSVSQSY